MLIIVRDIIFSPFEGCTARHLVQNYGSPRNFFLSVSIPLSSKFCGLDVLQVRLRCGLHVSVKAMRHTYGFNNAPNQLFSEFVVVFVRRVS